MKPTRQWFSIVLSKAFVCLISWDLGILEYIVQAYMKLKLFEKLSPYIYVHNIKNFFENGDGYMGIESQTHTTHTTA